MGIPDISRVYPDLEPVSPQGPSLINRSSRWTFHVESKIQTGLVPGHVDLGESRLAVDTAQVGKGKTFIPIAQGAIDGGSL